MTLRERGYKAKKKKKCLTNSITAEEIKWQQGAGEKKKVGQKDCTVLHTRDKWIIFSLCKEAKKKRKDSDE